MLGGRPQRGRARIGKRLEQYERGHELLAARLLAPERPLAIGQMDGGDGFLPRVAELSVHSGRLAVKGCRVLSVASSEQHLARAVERGGFPAVIPIWRSNDAAIR